MKLSEAVRLVYRQVGDHIMAVGDNVPRAEYRLVMHPATLTEIMVDEQHVTPFTSDPNCPPSFCGIRLIFDTYEPISTIRLMVPAAK